MCTAPGCVQLKDVYSSRTRPHILDVRRELNRFFNKLLDGGVVFDRRDGKHFLDFV